MILVRAQVVVVLLLLLLCLGVEEGAKVSHLATVTGADGVRG